MDTSVEIRLAKVEDALAIAHVHVASWRSTYPSIVPQHYIDSLQVQDFAERWQYRLLTQPEMVIYVAAFGGTICGFASCGPARVQLSGFSGEIYAIYLSKESHSKRIGSRLFWTAATHLERTGHSSMYLWVLKDNPACGFYERMGGTLPLPPR